MKTTSKILILDFGSQFTQLIARRLRELKVYCEIYPCTAKLKQIEEFKPDGLILSGGPFSVYDKKAPKADLKIFDLGIPILGVCYGMQFMAKNLGGTVSAAKTREYGRTMIHKRIGSSVLPAGGGSHVVWMSHGDEISKVPPGFTVTAVSENGSPASIENDAKNFYAVQFHPEVVHTENGTEIFKRFLFEVVGAKPDWDLSAYIDEQIQLIHQKVGPKGKAICALSGGVDSTVAATLVHRALGSRLQCVFVNNGLLRKDEAKQVMAAYRELHLNVKYVDASKHFLKKLKNVTDAEQKRKIIGREFIRIFEKHSKGAKFLVQGTLYPDVIESCPPPRMVGGKSHKIGFSSTIKSHHNVGGLPKNMKMELIEPLRELFKDEVREMGATLNVPAQILSRHPFPGPGLAVRVIGAITESVLNLLREVDKIFIDEIRHAGLYSQIWQAFAVYLPVRSVGVMGDGRTYDNVIALRAVTSSDGMTADWYAFQPEFLARVSSRVVNEVRGVSRVVYDVTSKPPSTIEWE